MTTISVLPIEILNRIFYYLPPKDLCSLSEVDQSFYRIVNDDSVWKSNNDFWDYYDGN